MLHGRPVPGVQLLTLSQIPFTFPQTTLALGTHVRMSKIATPGCALEFTDYRKKAIRYWERRRIIWNLILVPPSVFTYVLGAGFAVGIGDRSEFGLPTVVVLFCFAAVAANICFSFVYVIEFWVSGRDAEDVYCKIGRRLIFAIGCLIGISLALAGGKEIAILQYPV